MAAEDLKPEILQAVSDAVDAAYRRGFADGGAAMRNSIFNAVSVSDMQMPAEKIAVPQSGSKSLSVKTRVSMAAKMKSSTRAKRGLVRNLTQAFLREHPGTPWRVIADAVVKQDASISPSSVGTELRRGLEAGRYRHEGAHYFLADADVGEETTEHPHGDDSADLLSNRGEVSQTEPP